MRMWIVATGLLLFCVAGVVTAQSGADLYQQGVGKEQLGDYQGAIKIYERIVRDHARDRALVAKAKVHLGDSWLKLGEAKGRDLLNDVINNYKDQADMVAEARRHLAGPGAAQASGALTPRQFVDGLGFVASMTPGGRNFLVSYRGTGDLATLDIAPVETNAKRLIAKTGDLKEGSASWPIMSPDQRQVAFVWHSNSYYELCGWSSDSKSILAILRKQDDTRQLAWVSSADGAVQALQPLEWRVKFGSRPRLSPDGKYIAYSALERSASSSQALEASSAPSPIYILAADGSTETVLTKTGINEAPVWTPDGNHVLFTSNRSGSADLWSATVRDGKLVGAPSRVMADIGKIRAIGFSASGGFYYTRLTPGEGDNIFVADLDPISGHLRGASTLAIEASDLRPVWSPDGKSIAFARGMPPDLTIHSLDTGEEKTIPLPDPLAGQAAWLPDSKGLLQSTSQTGRLLFYRVDAKSGEFKKEDVTVVRNDSRPSALSPDGKTVYTTDAAVNGGDRQAVRAIDLTTGRQTEIFSTPGPRGALPDIALNPDGRTLAMLVFSGSGDRTQESVALIGVDGSNFHNIYTAARGELHNPERPALPCVAWSKDGRSVFFPRNIADGWELMRIPAAGGKPESTGLTGSRMNCMDLSPDGSRIAFGDGAGGSWWETLALDNILSALKK